MTCRVVHHARCQSSHSHALPVALWERQVEFLRSAWTASTQRNRCDLGGALKGARMPIRSTSTSEAAGALRPQLVDPFKKIVAGTSLTRPVLVDAKTCAAFLGVSLRTWERIAASKEGPRAVKVGRLTRWRVTDLESYVGALPTRATSVNREGATGNAGGPQDPGAGAL